MEESKGQILLYQTPGGESRIEVRLQDDTVWLSLDQMADLFQRNKSTISRHIKNVFEDGELSKELVVANFATTTQHGAIEGKTQVHQVEEKAPLIYRDDFEIVPIESAQIPSVLFATGCSNKN